MNVRHLTLPLFLSTLALVGPDCTASLYVDGPDTLPDPGDPAAPVDDAGTAVNGDDAAVVGAEFPSTIRCGEALSARVTMENTGTEPWRGADFVKLGVVDDEDPFYGPDTRVWLPESATVMPGGQWTFDIALVGPPELGVRTTDWRMVREGVHWFGAVTTHEIEVTCPAGPTGSPRPGLVRLDGEVLFDDEGPFVALGASLFWGAWGYRHDRVRLEENLRVLSENGFDYVRVLGVVGDVNGADYWDGREVSMGWPDYDAVIAGFTDLAYDGYGLRTEWTLIGDGQVTVPTTALRYELADRFLAMSAGREQKIMHFEVANEAWQNGFPGDGGLADLRALTSYLQERTEILVAASAPYGIDCSDVQALYGGGVGDLATIHFDRNVWLTEGSWRPVRQPWEHAYCEGVPTGSNNEPIGPGSSVASEEDPVKLVAAAMTTWIANIPMYVWHSRAGIRGDFDVWTQAGYDAFLPVRTMAPPDLPGWSRRNAHWGDSPFRVFAEEGGASFGDQMWVDLGSPTGGAVRAYGSVSGNNFVVFPIGILDHVRMEARRAMTYEVVHPMSGDLLSAGTLDAGGSITLSGATALLVMGAFL